MFLSKFLRWAGTVCYWAIYYGVSEACRIDSKQHPAAIALAGRLADVLGGVLLWKSPAVAWKRGLLARVLCCKLLRG